MRADALGCDGGPTRTPNIDDLAGEGLHFTFAHASSVLTLPSHTTILTGTYPFQHGVRDNSGYRLAAGTETLATRLKAAGFATGAFVAAFPLDARFGLAAGFDVYDGRFNDGGGGSEFLLAERPATFVIGHARAWIAAQTGRWFAWVHLYEPHAPYRPPAPFDAEYTAQPYYGEVAEVDRALGPLLEMLRASTRPTLVVLTGDHGEGLGDHSEMTHGLFAYESTLRVPLIVAQIGKPARNGARDAESSRSDLLVRHIDIVPTVLDILSIAPTKLPGHSLRTESDREGAPNRPSYFEAMYGLLAYGGAPLAGVIAGREKFISLPIPELYDLGRDPAEQDNRVDRGGDRLRALEAQLTAFAAALPATPRHEDADAARRLRSLGYVSSGAPRKSRYLETDDPKRLTDVDRQMHEAVTLAQQGRLAEAISIYRDVLAKHPGVTAAARHLAFALWRTGELRPAIAILQAALPSAPDETGVGVQLGTYLFEVGRTKEALQLLDRTARSGTDLDALNALGLAYARDGRVNDALRAFNRALALDPDNATTRENIGAVHLDGGRLDEARTEFEHAVRSNADSAQAHAGLALVASKQGDRSLAIEEWKRAVTLDPTSFDSLYDLGVQLAHDGRAAEARPYLEQFARTAPRAQYDKELRNVNALLRR